MKSREIFPIKDNDQFWKENLSGEQYQVLKEKGTDKPFVNKYYDSKENGLYVCAACGQILFSSEDKYNSGSGWPSFTKPINNDNIVTTDDNKLRDKRIEVICSCCGGHLGHKFDDGPEPSGTRFCINSTSLHFLETAYFAMGCFWGPDVIFSSLSGVHSTVVGYAGGTKKDPTYKKLDDHSETIKVLYYPDLINFERLLDVFWQNHSPTNRPYSSQYKSILFFTKDKQQNHIKKFVADKREESESKVFTEIKPLEHFYQAELYHQKYRLRQNEELFTDFMRLFESEEEFIFSTIASRLNAFSGGRLSSTKMEEELKHNILYILYPEEIERIMDNIKHL